MNEENKSLSKLDVVAALGKLVGALPQKGLPSHLHIHLTISTDGPSRIQILDVIEGLAIHIYEQNDGYVKVFYKQDHVTRERFTGQLRTASALGSALQQVQYIIATYVEEGKAPCVELC